VDRRKTGTRVQRPPIAQSDCCVIKVCAQMLFAPASTMVSAVAAKCAGEGHVSPSLVNVRALGIVAPAWCVVRVSAVHLRSAIRVSVIKSVDRSCTVLNSVSNAPSSQVVSAGRARRVLKGKIASQSMTTRV
jgi:hypothetical protein